MCKSTRCDSAVSAPREVTASRSPHAGVAFDHLPWGYPQGMVPDHVQAFDLRMSIPVETQNLASQSSLSISSSKHRGGCLSKR